jgi:uncharacterized protein YuzE
MRFTYDSDADAANIFLKDVVAPGELVRGTACNTQQEDTSLALSFNERNELVCIEILGARKLLPPELLMGDQRLCSDQLHHGDDNPETPPAPVKW